MTRAASVRFRSLTRLVPVAAVLAWATTAGAGGLAFLENHPTPTQLGDKDIVDVAVSANGANVYTASENESTIDVYTRNLGTGAITFLESHTDGMAGVDGIRFNTGVAVTPDGNCVYGLGRGDNAIATFSRNLGTGALTFVGTNPVMKPEDLVISPDNLHVYVLGTDVGSLEAIEVFSRTPPACALAFVEHETGDASTLGKSTEGIAISPDGAHVYAGGTFTTATEPAVNVLSRNAVTGALTFVERQYNGAVGVDRLGKATGMAVSPDGGSVYAASRGEDSIVVFARNGVTGALTFVEYQRDGGVVDGLKGVIEVAVSPDNAYLYAVGRGDAGVATFRRDTTTGALRFLQDLEDPYVDPPNAEVLIGPFAIAVSPGGANVYTGGRGSVVFDVDVCGNGIVGTDEQCDDGNVLSSDGCSSTCRLELCGPVPAGGCRGTQPGGSSLKIRTASPTTKNQLQYKWKTGDATTIVDYGNPVTTASYVVCVYDSSANPQPLLADAAPAGGLCKKNKPCWTTGVTTDKYNDGLYTPDGLQSIQLKEGLVNGKAQISVKGRGINVLPTGLPLPVTLPVTVQIKNTQTGVCWESVMSTASQNLGDYFKATGD